MAVTENSIRQVEAWNCAFKLSVPMFVGRTVWRRQYTIVRITTYGGAVGLAYSNSDNAPLDMVITEQLAPNIVDRDALDIPALHGFMATGLLPLVAEGIAQRALSLVDICLWDINAQVAEQPLWAFLGGSASTVPVMTLEGYPVAGEDAAGFGVRLAERAAEGYRHFKLVEWLEPEEMLARLGTARSAVGDEMAIAVDMNWRWDDVNEGIALARSWEAFDLSWLEDPFFAHRTGDIIALRESTRIPVAIGDCASVYGMDNPLHRLVEQEEIDVLRVDATRHGGVTGIRELVSLADDHGIPTSPHTYPELHRHCALAWPHFGPIEMFPPNREFDFSHVFIHREAALQPVDGQVAAPEVPGIGLAFEWDVVERASTRYGAVTGDG